MRLEDAVAPLAADRADPAISGAAFALEPMVNGSANAIAATAIPLVKLLIL
ncbi:hypothetical protein GCM10022626_26650 [[Pseudomonas] carboxydohydrogena]